MSLFLGDSLEVLKTFEPNSVDAAVTDPPYGLSFMGKKWDYDVPSVELWREVFRVLKPGGHALIACGTRTQHRMAVNIEDAGFEIRDVITWLYGSGFPKSHNLNGEWQGFGTALKPACEFWTLVRKPLSEKTMAANVLKWGTGAINIDASRIATDELKGKVYNNQNTGWKCTSASSTVHGHESGRWPANLILDEGAAELLDAQVGFLHGAGNKSIRKAGVGEKSNSVTKAFGAENGPPTIIHDRGGQASRFFYVAKASKRERNAGLEEMPLKKRSDANKMMGDSGPMKTGSGNDRTTEFQNHHPTVKPIKLMEYLCKLITPPGGVILDPFMGSGSTGIAAKNLGFKFIGIELNEEYLEIARKRILIHNIDNQFHLERMEE